jgi:hypothetical protein
MRTILNPLHRDASSCQGGRGFALHQPLPLLLALALALPILLPTSLHAARIPVDNAPALMAAMSGAVAGDTILVAPGTYAGDLALSGDPGNLPNGTGYFWVGNDGTASDPIVVIGSDPASPPRLEGAAITGGYVVHVTGDHVVLKNLVITRGDKGVIFDNASDGVLEDCEVFNVGSELVHVRDASDRVVLSRNRLYSSGNAGNGSIGEGFYIGTDQARWGADDVPQSGWGSEAIAEGYGGYDWRVDSTQVLCNWLSGISAELMDIKEGTRFTHVEGNMFVADSIGLKPGAQSYDDSFIDLKGVRATIVGNSFWNGGTSAGIAKYVAEVTRIAYAQVPDSLTTAGYADPWCDTGDADNNDCAAASNTIATAATDPRGACVEQFPFEYGPTAISGRWQGGELSGGRLSAGHRVSGAGSDSERGLQIGSSMRLGSARQVDAQGRKLGASWSETAHWFAGFAPLH